MKSDYDFVVHPNFNLEYYEDALKYAIAEARPFGLAWEVSESYDKALNQIFKESDAPLLHEDYIEQANYALYEWDI